MHHPMGMGRSTPPLVHAACKLFGQPASLANAYCQNRAALQHLACSKQASPHACMLGRVLIRTLGRSGRMHA